MSGMGNSLANSFLEYHVPSTWLKPSNLEPRDYREAYIKVSVRGRPCYGMGGIFFVVLAFSLLLVLVLVLVLVSVVF